MGALNLLLAAAFFFASLRFSAAFYYSDYKPVAYFVSNWTSGANYTQWTEGKKFYLGDTLTFTVTAEETVVPVPKDAYESCSWFYHTGPFPGLDSSWNLTFVPILGHNYYISSVQEHCKSGMKLEVQVLVPPDTHAYSPKDYTVGDDKGWSLGVNYSEWTSGKTFYAGDEFKFVFNQSMHTVVGVLEEGYEHCNESYYYPLAAGFELQDNGYAQVRVVPLEGHRYFTSSVNGDCEAGLKLELELLPTSDALQGPSPSPSSFDADAPSAFLAQESSATAPSVSASLLMILCFIFMRLRD